MKTLKNKFLTTAGIVLVGGASLVLGRFTKVLYDNPVDRFIIDDFVPEAMQPLRIIKVVQEIKREEKGIALPPEHVVWTHGGMWRPEEGYVWVNPEPAKNKDYRVRKVENEIANFFACRDLRDLDSNGKLDYPEDYVDIKNKFSANETVTLVSKGTGKKGDQLELKIFNQNGKEIQKHSFINSSDSPAIAVKFSKEDDLAYGNFIAVWYLNGNQVGLTEFEIIKSK